MKGVWADFFFNQFSLLSCILGFIALISNVDDFF